MKASRLTGLLAALTLLAITVGVPWLLVRLGAGPGDVFGNPAWRHLLEPDDGSLVLAVLGAVAWVAWAVLAALVVAEVVATLRGVHVPTLSGLRAPQGAIRNLVAAATLLFSAPAVHAAAPTAAVAPAATVATGEIPALLTAPVGGGFDAAPGVEAVSVASALPVATTAPSVVPTTSPVPAPVTTAAPGTVVYTVMRGDSLWRIAESHLGDPTRLTEIVDLNRSTLGDDPDFLLPGTQLLLPERSPSRGGGTYVVEPGDTLSSIASDELGAAERYPEIYEASKDVVQPGGGTITDPDLIHPGDVVVIPSDSTSTPGGTTAAGPATPAAGAVAGDAAAPAADAPTEVPTPEVTHSEPGGTFAPSPGPLTTRPAPRDERSPTAAAAPSHTTTVGEADATHDEEATSSWLLPGLAGAGSLTAATLFVAVRARRRTQGRFRKTGQMPHPLPANLRPIDRTARVVGIANAHRLLGLDALLDHLTSQYPSRNARPKIATVEVSSSDVVLHLAADDTLPAPWTGGGRRWAAVLPATRAENWNPERSAMLIVVGIDAAGHLWLVNLEHVGTLAVVGDHTRAAAFARAVTMDVCLAPRSSLVDVTAVGLGAELKGVNVVFFNHHATADASTFTSAYANLDLQGTDVDGPEIGQYVVADASAVEPGVLSDLAARIAGFEGRSEVGLLIVGEAPTTATVAQIDATGRLRIESLGIDVTAVGLTVEEATASRDLAVSADLGEDAENDLHVPFPAPVDEPDPALQLANVAGGLLREHAASRPKDPAEPAGGDSVLSLAADQYLAAAPVTVEDLDALAPVVPPETSTHVEAATDTLDDDVADYLRGSDCTRPRLAVLGPVRAWGKGDPNAAAKRRPFLTALLGYLVLHPNGASADQLHWFGTDRLRIHVSDLRKWLGYNPRTGREYLPSARATRASQLAGAPRYQVDDVLCDWILFKKLRVRGEARGGDAGIADLETALLLVTGEPLTDKHEAGWVWLDETVPEDAIATRAIADVAVTVGTHWLATGDIARARVAADVGLKAAPYEDRVRVLHIDVLAKEGHQALAETLLKDDVVQHSWDSRTAIDLPPGTREIVERHIRRARKEDHG